jgi:GNAT superfamily N-acetyltransferase
LTDKAAEPTRKNGYPAHREADVALRDGSTVRVRPVRAEDEDAMLRFLEGLDQGSRMFRFFSAGTDLNAAARLMTDVDYSRMYGLIAVRGANDDVVAQGNYFTGRPGEAEIAFTIAQDLQGFGLGTLLLAHLAEVAQDNGISVFTAEVMPDNHRMIEVFRESGFPVETSSQPGSIHIELPTSFSGEAITRFEERDRLAAQAAIRPFLDPRAVAVVGASRKHGTVGGQLFHNALESGFEASSIR